MKDQLEKVEFLDTSIYKVIHTSPLQNDVLAFLHEQWGTAGKGPQRFPPFFPGPQPVSIERRHFVNFYKQEYVVCEKTDGVRHVCICMKYQDKKLCLLVNRALDVFLVSLNMPRKSYTGTILDGELARGHDGKWHYLVYDAVTVNGQDVRDLDLLARIERADSVVKGMMRMAKDPLTMKLKTFYKFRNFEKFYTHEFPKIEFETDGLVMTPVADPVRVGTHETMFKWKPRDQNTVDFQVKRRRDGTTWGLYIQEKGNLFFQSTLPVNTAPPFNEDDIVECRYMVDDPVPWWCPVMVRPDKTYPNSRRTFYRTMKNISEDIHPDEFISVCKKLGSDDPPPDTHQSA